jgi:P4 family phage/plasmid primase-like protien
MTMQNEIKLNTRMAVAKEAMAAMADSEPIFKMYGPPFLIDNNGKLSVNERAVAFKCAAKHTIVYDSKARAFMRFDAGSGLWMAASEPEVRRLIGDLLLELGQECKLLKEAQALKVANFAAVAKMMQSYQSAVKTLPATALVHATNGVVDLRGERPKLLPHDAGYNFTTSAGVKYAPAAKCQRFEKVLLGQALDRDDILLLQKYFGSMLLGPNITHGILVIRGTPGGGKSTLVTVVEKILGIDQVAQLRTTHLGGRFETSAFIGKRLLEGKDVGGDTLSNAGAHFLKSLVGGDQLQAEIKFNPKKHLIMGDYHVVITANSNLSIALDGDVEAWRRRLLIVDFARPKTTKPEPNLAENLVVEEASGILNWMVAGALLCRKESAERGRIVLTNKQQERVTGLLKDSDNVPAFMAAAVSGDEAGDVTSEELLLSYHHHCRKNGWKPVPGVKFQTRMPDLLAQEYGILRRNDIRREGHAVRGYKGISLN